MDGAAFVGELKNGSNMDPKDNVFRGIWAEYERVILQSLVTSFGLDFLVQDQYGGDVDTIHNVREIGSDPAMSYKNSENKIAYESVGQYTKQLQAEYHGGDIKYKQINAMYSEQKKNGKLVDAYTGKVVARNANIDLDHAIATKEIHEDPGRVLSGMTVQELANTEWNLNPTDRTINRSMQDTDKEIYLQKHEARTDQRHARIEELKTIDKLSDKERKELEKLEKLDEIDPEIVRANDEKARRIYEAEIARKYYTSPQFVKDTAAAVAKRGAEMGLRQALGFIFVEIWMCTKEELQAVPAGSSLEEMLNTVGNGIKKGLESAKSKYKEIAAKVGEGFVSGALASLTTTLCNIFFTTAKNLVRCIRQVYASVVQAGRVLLFNPQNQMLGDRIKTTTVILASGASVLAGTAVGALIAETPIGAAPGVGPIVTAFCSSLVSGLLSCTLLLFLDRSKFINDLVDKLNAIPSDANNFKEIADAMEILAAKIANLDIDKFMQDTERFADIAMAISQCDDDDAVNTILYNAYEKLDIQIPWKGDFDSFMGNRNNRLVFG